MKALAILHLAANPGWTGMANLIYWLLSAVKWLRPAAPTWRSARGRVCAPRR